MLNLFSTKIEKKRKRGRRKKDEVLMPRTSFREMMAYADDVVKYDFSLEKLHEHILNTENKDVDVYAFWQDSHDFLIYLDQDLYVKLVKGFGSRRKNNQAYCKTHRIFEKRLRVATWLKKEGKQIWQEIKSIFYKLMNIIIKFIGKLAAFIGSLFNYNFFCSVFAMFNKEHDEKYGFNYNNDPSVKELLGEVDDWSGVPKMFDNNSIEQEKLGIFDKVREKVKDFIEKMKLEKDGSMHCLA